MMDLQTIRNFSRKAALEAAANKREPFILGKEDLEDARNGDLSAIDIPSIGDYLPEGWKRVSLENIENERGVYMGDNEGFGAYFVDKSGFGADNEPALSLECFLLVITPGLGYAVVEEGQFQVKVGVFTRERKV